MTQKREAERKEREPRSFPLWILVFCLCYRLRMHAYVDDVSMMWMDVSS
jgi:hypothetical protein